MRVCVTGGTGFTGAALVLRLLDEGHAVSVLDNKPGLIADELKARGATLRYASVLDRTAVAEAVAGCDTVMHLAAAFRELDVPSSVYRDVNRDGTRIVGEESVKAGVRKLVYCSTQGVHGHIEQPPGDETSPIAPCRLLPADEVRGRARAAAVGIAGARIHDLETDRHLWPRRPGPLRDALQACETRRVPDVRQRPNFLPSGLHRQPRRLFPARGAARQRIGRGVSRSATQEYFSIEDLVQRVGQAIGVDVRIAHYPIWPLIAAGHVCEKLCKPFGITPPIFPRRVDWFRQVRAFRIDKARRDFGYVPRVGIDEGLRRTGEWYSAHGYI